MGRGWAAGQGTHSSRTTTGLRSGLGADVRRGAPLSPRCARRSRPNHGRATLRQSERRTCRVLAQRGSAARERGAGAQRGSAARERSAGAQLTLAQLH